MILLSTDTLSKSDAAEVARVLRQWAVVVRTDFEDTPLFDRLRAAHRNGQEAPGLIWYCARADQVRQERGAPPLDRVGMAAVIDVLADMVERHRSAS